MSYVGQKPNATIPPAAGMVKSNGTQLQTAVANTDYLPATNPSVAGTLALQGSAGTAGQVPVSGGTGQPTQWGNVGVSDGNKGDVLVSGSGANWTVKSAGGAAMGGFRNKIINGAFGINQRGYVSGATTSAGQYTLDRWKVTGAGGITFSTVNNKTTVTIPAGQTLQQVIEGLNLQSGNYVLSWEGTAQGRIGAGAYGASGAVTAAITGGANTTIEFNAGTVTNVQLEAGSVATPFETRSVGQELALCQRYYYRLSATSSNTADFGVGPATATTLARGTFPFPVQMRTAPTAIEQSGTATDYTVFNGTSINCSSVPTFSYASVYAGQIQATVASGLTVGQCCIVRAALTTSGYFGWSAEL